MIRKRISRGEALGSEFGQELLKRAERAHYSLQSALFLRDRKDLPGASLVSAGKITDPDWNHAGLVDLDPARLSATLASIRNYFHSRGLPAVIAASPFSEPRDLAARLRDRGFVTAFRHAWHFAAPRPVPTVDLAGGFEIRTVTGEEDMRALVEVFESVYAVDLETGEPDEWPKAYGDALRRSFRTRRPGLDVVHYLATSAGEPAAVATSIHGDGMSGLYNLAVLPRFRRRGLGGALVRRRARDALARGQEAVFLQTERKSVERRLVRHGFAKAFTTVGFVEEES